MEKEAIKNGNVNKLITDLAFASLEGDVSKSELILIALSKALSKENPELSAKVKEAISLYSLRGTSGMRSGKFPPLPVDGDTHLEMASVITPNLDLYPLPILNSSTEEKITGFLEERKNIHLLMDKNIRPSNSLLLIGQPGTGKTMLAKHIASSLNKNLIVLDLSASISSLLGKTGHNLKKVLQYAKHTASVLLLDEFDAIAKRRDDNTDLGEIKRVVNVLLMELEDWPISSVLIATSNHPELLDRAIWRRFDHTVEIPIPSLNERTIILTTHLRELLGDNNDFMNSLSVVADLLDGKSAADVCKFSNNIKRRIVIKKDSPEMACFIELESSLQDKKSRAKLSLISDKLGLSVREIAPLIKMSPSGVQYHKSKNKKK